MFSLTPSELLTIGIVALVVFGPRRLPELARRAGQMVSYLRRAAAEIRDEVQGELGPIVDPLREVTAEIKAQAQALKDAASTEVDKLAQPFREAGTNLAAEGKSLIETADGELRWVDEESP